MPNPFRLLATRARTIERDAFELVLGDGRAIQVQRVRDARARRIKLSVDDRGARMTVPSRASAATAERFALEQRDWLAAQLDRHAPADLPRLRPFETATLPLRGCERPLRWVEGRYAGVQGEGEDDDPLLFTLPPRAGAAAAARALREFYEAQARADVGRWLPRYLAGLPRAPRRFRFKVMRSQWGSLAPDGSVALDLSLVLARPSAFEYVLVHELCHLIHHDHSRAFWHEVAARWPHWRDERAWFQAHGSRLKGSLRSLLASGG
jgi:predicted metal-dependent hydrolase